MKPFRLVVNLLLALTLPIWGGWILFFGFFNELVDGASDITAIAKGDKWIWKIG